MAARHGTGWTAQQELQVAVMYASGLTNREIGDRIGRTAGAISERLGVLRKLGALEGVKPDPNLIRKPENDLVHHGYLPVPEACVLHAETVMAQGGFAWLSEKSLGSGRYAVCLPLMWPKKEEFL